MTRQIHLICNAHLDPVWLWEWQEGAAEAISTFRTAAELCEKNRTFVFNHNEVILYEWVREYEPQLFKRIKKLVRQGRWHIMGGWYLQPDCNMPSGESFVRQILAGRQYFKKHFGVKPKTAINVDPFGHSRGLVQVLAQAGFTAYLFGRPQNTWMQLDEMPFIWEGFAGAKVFARRFTGWYNTALGKSRAQIEERIARSPNVVEAILWGVGNHGGGPSRKDLSDINALIRDCRDVQILHSTPDAYFEQVSKQPDALPRRDSDLNPWAIGCYTSMIRVKQKHRQLENELYMTEKMASAAAANKRMTYPTNDILQASRDLMFAQFHDILPGSSIQPVEEAALRLMDHGLEILSRVKMRSFVALAAGQKKAAEGQIPILVYNPHPFRIEQIVECEFNLPDCNTDGSFMDVDVRRHGKPVSGQVEKELSNLATDWRKRVVFRASLEPGQMNRFDCTLRRLKRQPPIRTAIETSPFIFKNERLNVVLNPKTGLIDRFRVDGVDYLANGAFARLYWRTTKTLGKCKKSNLEKPSADSGFCPAGPVDLHADRGGSPQLLGQKDSSSIGCWTNNEAWVSWDFTGAKPDTYEVMVDVAGPDDSKAIVEIGKEKLSIAFAKTGSYNNYQPQVLGRIQIADDGTQQLSIRPDKEGWKAVNLKQVTLRPVDTHEKR